MIQLEISVVLVVLFVIYHVIRRVQLSHSEQSWPIQTQGANPRSPISVSFLVPAWNAADAIPMFVASFQKLDVEDKQLILSAGGPDESYQVAKRFDSGQIVVSQQTQGMGKQQALRQSLPDTTGDVIFLTDIDCQLDNDMVHRMLSEMSDARTVVTGGIRPLQKEHTPLVTVQWAIRRFSSPRKVCETNGLLGANTAILKSTLEAIGGFSVDAQSGTDYTLAKEVMAKGHKIWFVPNCEMATEFPDTLKTYIHKQSRWLRNVLVIGPKYQAWAELRAIASTLLLPYVYVMLLFTGFFLPVLWTLLVLLMLHATLNRMHYVSIHGQPVPVYSAFVSTLGDLAAAIQAVAQWLFRKYTW